ncbi:MAG: tetratricopeptide repeat protein [bacterium]|nr:tetratricopeptide repeat protein [bacterium]
MAFGVAMAKHGLWSEALFRFEQVERSHPNNPRNLNNLAVACEALGQFDRALDYYQSAIKADPTNKELKRNYSRFVEFYRSFKPDDQEGDEDDGS